MSDIILYPLANLRSHNAVAKIIDEINQTHTIYPQTNLKMKFKIATTQSASSQEF